MSKREKALAICRGAGYHGDQKAFTRAYIENKLSYSVAMEAYNAGIKAKENGMPCSCAKCKGAI